MPIYKVWGENFLGSCLEGMGRFLSLIIWGGQVNASNSKETFLFFLIESPK